MNIRKVILYIATSLDGYIADSHGNIDWLDQTSTNDDIDTSYDDFYSKVDTVVMGRNTYDQVTTELAPNNYPYSDSYSYIFTSKKHDNTENLTFLNSSIVTLINNLKKEAGGDIFIIGGANTIAPLIENNLIDEYQIATIPIILGQGISLFKPMDKSILLDIIDVKRINNIIYSKYQAKKLI